MLEVAEPSVTRAIGGLMMINKIVKQCLGVIDSAPHSLTVLSGVYLIFSSHIIWEAYYSVASADHISLGYIQGSRKHFWGRIQANKVVYRDVPLETAHRELFWPSFLLHNPEKNDFKNSRSLNGINNGL